MYRVLGDKGLKKLAEKGKKTDREERTD